MTYLSTGEHNPYNHRGFHNAQDNNNNIGSNSVVSASTATSNGTSRFPTDRVQSNNYKFYESRPILVDNRNLNQNNNNNNNNAAKLSASASSFTPPSASNSREFVPGHFVDSQQQRQHQNRHMQQQQGQQSSASMNPYASSYAASSVGGGSHYGSTASLQMPQAVPDFTTSGENYDEEAYHYSYHQQQQQFQQQLQQQQQRATSPTNSHAKSAISFATGSIVSDASSKRKKNKHSSDVIDHDVEHLAYRYSSASVLKTPGWNAAKQYYEIQDNHKVCERTVYLAHIPGAVSDEQLRALLSQYGEVAKARVFGYGTKVNNADDGSHVAKVEFTTPDAVEKMVNAFKKCPCYIVVDRIYHTIKWVSPSTTAPPSTGDLTTGLFGPRSMRCSQARSSIHDYDGTDAVFSDPENDDGTGIKLIRPCLFGVSIDQYVHWSYQLPSGTEGSVQFADKTKFPPPYQGQGESVHAAPASGIKYNEHYQTASNHPAFIRRQLRLLRRSYGLTGSTQFIEEPGHIEDDEEERRLSQLSYEQLEREKKEYEREHVESKRVLKALRKQQQEEAEAQQRKEQQAQSLQQNQNQNDENNNQKTQGQNYSTTPSEKDDDDEEEEPQDDATITANQVRQQHAFYEQYEQMIFQQQNQPNVYQPPSQRTPPSSGAVRRSSNASSASSTTSGQTPRLVNPPLYPNNSTTHQQSPFQQQQQQQQQHQRSPAPSTPSVARQSLSVDRERSTPSSQINQPNSSSNSIGKNALAQLAQKQHASKFSSVPTAVLDLGGGDREGSGQRKFSAEAAPFVPKN